jgi:hypothetical protein
VNGLKHPEKHSMKHYAGLDVSVKETSICIVDEAGKICRELKVPSHPEDLLRVLLDQAWNLERVGLEAGPRSQWLFNGLAEADQPVVCIETRHARAYLKAQISKTRRNDARGIAQGSGGIPGSAICCGLPRLDEFIEGGSRSSLRTESIGAS